MCASLAPLSIHRLARTPPIEHTHMLCTTYQDSSLLAVHVRRFGIDVLTCIMLVVDYATEVCHHATHAVPLHTQLNMFEALARCCLHSSHLEHAPPARHHLIPASWDAVAHLPRHTALPLTVRFLPKHEAGLFSPSPRA